MLTSRLPLEINNFLIEYIDSVSHLEVLLMLFTQPEKAWTSEEVGKELRSNLSSATNQLATLHQKGLLRKNEDNTYQYRPATKELDERVKLTSELYQEKPVAIVTCIFDKPNVRLKSFADAFKIKKD